MYKKIIFIFILCISNAFTEGNNLNVENILKSAPNDILKRVDNNRSPNTSFLTDITVIDENIAENKKSTFTLLVGADNEKSFAIYQSPTRQKGQSILSIGQNIWIYMPGTKNSIKISPVQKLIGQASVADVLSLLYYPNYDVISYKKEKNLYILQLKAKNRQVAYSAIELTIDEKAMPKEAIFFALSGKPIKNMIFQDFKMMAGAIRPSSVIISDYTNKDLRTTINFENMRKKNIPSSHFNRNNIGNLSGLY